MRLPYIFENPQDIRYAIRYLMKRVTKAIEQYGFVTIADVYDYMDDWCAVLNPTLCNYTDVKRGWTSIDELFARGYCERRWGWSEYGIVVDEPKFIE